MRWIVEMMMAAKNSHVTPINMENIQMQSAEHREEGDKRASQIERPYVKTVGYCAYTNEYIHDMRINKWMGQNIFVMENKHKFKFCDREEFGKQENQNPKSVHSSEVLLYSHHFYCLVFASCMLIWNSSYKCRAKHSTG